MVWLIALGVLILITIIPIGISAFYDVEGSRVIAYVGPIRISVFPTKQKGKTEKVKKPGKRQIKRQIQRKKVERLKISFRLLIWYWIFLRRLAESYA